MSEQRASPRRASSALFLLLLACAAGIAWFWPQASSLATQWASRTEPPMTQLPAQSPVQPLPTLPPIPGPFDGGPQPPSFDVVRVSPNGSAVIAGQAEPGAEVTVKDGDTVIGHVKADRQGNWVLLPDAPLTAGGRELSVVETAPDGSETLGRDTVLLSIPRAASGETPAALLLPQGGEARLLQAGAAPAAPPGVASAAPPIAQPLAPPVAPPLGAAPALAPVAAAAPTPPTPMPPTPTLPAPTPTVFRPVSPKLGLGTVDYTEQGEIHFAGTAAPNAPVRVYVDDAPSGDATADATGKWGLVPPQAVAGGVHRLRIDQLSAAGRVVSRVELPFERSTLPAETIANGRVVVQPGQNLWRMARKVYGSGVRYTVIYLANQDQIRNPKLIYPGQAFSVPNP